MAIQTGAVERGFGDARSTGYFHSRASRIADIAALIAAIAAGGATLIAVMSYQNVAMQEKITAAVSPLAVAIVEMDKRLSGGRLDQVHKPLDRVDLRLDRMDQRIERIEGRLGSVEQRMSGLEASMSGVNSRLSRIEGKVGKQRWPACRA